jgi:Tfp pilus assembly protein PilF
MEEEKSNTLKKKFNLSQDKLFKIFYVSLAFFVVALVVFVIYMYGGNNRVTEKDKEKVAQLYTEAQADYASADYTQAIETIYDAMEIDSGDVNLYLLLCDIYEKKNRYDLVIDFLQSVEGKMRQDPLIQRRLGRAHCIEGNNENCINTVSNFYSVETFDREEFLMQEALLNLERYEEVSKKLDGLSKCENRWQLQGLLIKSVNSGVEYSKVLEWFDNCESDYYGITETASYVGSLEQLKEEDLSEDVKNIKYLLINSNLALKRGYSKLAINKLTNSNYDLEENWEAQFILGSAYNSLGDYAKAEEYLIKASALNQYSYKVDWVLADVYNSLGRNDTSQDKYLRAIALAGDESPAVREDYIDFLKDNKYTSFVYDEYIKLITSYEQTSKNDKYLEANLDAAKLYYDLDKMDLVNEFLGNITSEKEDLEISYIKDEYYLFKCEMLVEQNEYTKVENILEVDNFAEDSYENYCLGLYHFVQGEKDEATEAFDEAVDADTTGVISEKVKRYR